MTQDQMIEVLATLDECSEFLDQRADVDCQGDPPEYVPNRAMRLAERVDDLRVSLRRIK